MALGLASRFRFGTDTLTSWSENIFAMKAHADEVSLFPNSATTNVPLFLQMPPLSVSTEEAVQLHDPLFSNEMRGAHVEIIASRKQH